ncbi:MAG TPA: glutamine--fructose-6-phosphate transaminase (isomerizing) [Blastocatellia bacterium]|nr:glutamine--fructose-6-phosphate transaminase (isomerizing) [Blastocatellia bacterium]
MSGIIGYVGNRDIVPLLLGGLRRLEYRGYDSAGIAVGGGGRLEVRRAAGKLRNLEEVVRLHPLDGTYGIGHTRWATHGRPTEQNAHPHCDCTGRIAVVHNGIIENYLTLKNTLAAEGHVFKTDTDTEVIAHLIEKYSADGSPLEAAVRRTVRELEGIFALVIISADLPDTLIVVREGSPVVIGVGRDEYFVASDAPAILYHTRDVVFLGDHHLGVITREGVRISDFDGNTVTLPVERIGWDPISVEKGGFPHFMLKEIFEQPRAVRETLARYISSDRRSVVLDDLDVSEDHLRQLRSIRLVACGGSWHAALCGKFMIEALARIPVEVDYSSEFRYRDPILDDRTLVLAVSQSGETADTLAAVREARGKGARVLAICNVRGSTITREVDGTIYTYAGPEIGVASTKAFTTQLVALLLFSLSLGRLREEISHEHAQRLLAALLTVPSHLERLLTKDDRIMALAREFFRASGFFFLGRGINYPIALEGALKLKELSYVYAEGYPAGEMKHGPNALIDEHLPVVAINPRDPESTASRVLYEKTLANIVEVKARDGIVIGVVSEGDEDVRQVADRIIEIPTVPHLLLPILAIVPLQLLAYHIAVLRGCDVDQPRNLAKSVTVE